MSATPAEVLADMGRAIADRRRNRGLSQEELAWEADVAVRTVSRVETGRGSFESCFLLARVLGFDLMAAIRSEVAS